MAPPNNNPINSMNKKLYIPLILVITFCIISCWKEKEKKVQQEQVESSVSIKESMKPENRVVNYDSLFNKLLPLGNLVLQNPSDTAHIRPLLDAAYDSVSGVFYCIGKGTMNPKLPEAAQQQAIKRAAQNTGMRWAIYLKSWQKGNMVSLDRNLSGQFSAGSTLLLEKNVGDTLFQLLSVSAEDINIL